MAYDRYDSRGGPRDRNPRWSDDRFESHGRRGGDDRGWFERAGEEIRSWFGDEDERRDLSPGDRYQQGREQGWNRDREFSPRGDSDDRGRFWRDRSWDRDDFERDDRFEGSRGIRERSFGQTGSRGRDDYRPITGDYGRSEQFFAAGGTPRGSFNRNDRFDRSPGRDDQRRQMSSSGRSRDFDPHYHTWRERQVDALDRDYDEYSQERQSRFEDDFSTWREQRQSKRQLLGQVREHMEVVGSDEQHVGTIDRVAGDRLILTKSDPEAGGAHHSLSCADIDRIEGERLILSVDADQARKRWRDESRGRALFEREDQGSAGPHVLDRSFEGTYR